MSAETSSHPETGRGMWHRAVARHPDAVYLRWGAESWTYAEADDAMRRFASGLSARGIGRGTRVLVGMDNSPANLFIHMALREIGAVLVALVPSLTFDELAYQINHSEGEYLIADGVVGETLLERSGEFEGLREVIGPAGQSPSDIDIDRLGEGPRYETVEDPSLDDMAISAILYTSGSTAKPKGVMMPAGGFYSGGKGYADRFGIGPDDNYICPMTLAHGLGAFLVQSIVIYSGGTLTLADRFSPSTFWNLVAESGATCTLLFPAQCNLLLKTEENGPAKGESSLRLVISHAWHEEFRQRFGIEMCTVWGSTETGTTGAGSVPGVAGSREEGYLGKPLPEDTEIAIRGEDGSFLPPGEIGEIVLRHRHMMTEYLKDPEATAKTLVDGWLRTGDLGSMTDDGEIYFRGRQKNMIKRSGENISPEQIETVLLEHPGVAEVVAFGVPDPIRTEELAVVVTAKGALEPREVTEYVATKLARWKAPRYVEVRRERMPSLGSGKIDRNSVIAQFELSAAWDRESESA